MTSTPQPAAAAAGGPTAGGAAGDRKTRDDAPAPAQAVVCSRLDGPRALQLQSWPLAAPGPGEVLVRIAAAGVNFPDLLMTRGTYQFRPPLPFAPGIEAAGIVAGTGAGVQDWHEGDRVVASARHGLFATAVVLPAAQLRAAPAGFSAAESACYLVAAHTARHALVDRAALRAGETLLVLGAGGGMGLAAVEVGKLLGARVIAAASSTDKLAAARASGADHAVDYGAGELLEQLRALAPEGVDAIFDPVGGELLERALRACAWGARVLIVGFASGRGAALPANVALLKGCSILGVRAGEAMRRDPQLATRSTRELAAWTAAGHLRPRISLALPLAQAADALELLETRRAVGRIALIADPALR